MTEGSCNQSQVYIPASNAFLKENLSLLLTAQTTGKIVRFYAVGGGCQIKSVRLYDLK